VAPTLKVKPKLSDKGDVASTFFGTGSNGGVKPKSTTNFLEWKSEVSDVAVTSLRKGLDTVMSGLGISTARSRGRRGATAGYPGDDSPHEIPTGPRIRVDSSSSLDGIINEASVTNTSSLHTGNSEIDGKPMQGMVTELRSFEHQAPDVALSPIASICDEEATSKPRDEIPMPVSTGLSTPNPDARQEKLTFRSTGDLYNDVDHNISSRSSIGAGSDDIFTYWLDHKAPRACGPAQQQQQQQQHQPQEMGGPWAGAALLHGGAAIEVSWTVPPGSTHDRLHIGPVARNAVSCV